MTSMQLNADLFLTLGKIAEDESLMKKLLKYAKKLAEKKEDETLMTKDAFFSRIDNARNEPSKSFANVKELDQYIRNL
ncbi:MAG: hypothetical protein IJR32_02315 [Paludibacteraceae bacterium]|nr:hypothetical protein [Paludibacteraceae bacterium]MCR4619651.1 hypothetical protein [Paludibacteraceae bacterium]